MSDTGTPVEGDRIVANTTIDYLTGDVVYPGDEGVVTGYTGRDGDDISVEWDRGFIGSAHFADLTVIEEG